MFPVVTEVTTLFRDLDDRRLSGPVENGLVGPVGADPDGKVPMLNFLVTIPNLVNLSPPIESWTRSV